MRIALFTSLLFFALMSSAQVNPMNVTIARDHWGVPHILGKTDADAAFGLAWAHAEDDFTNIQYVLLSGKKMLGRVLGKKGAEVDYVVELLRCRDIVEEKIGTLSPEFLKVAEAYVQGLNEFAAANPEKVLLKKAFPASVKDYLAAATFSLCIISGMDELLPKLLKGEYRSLPEPLPNGSNAFAIHPSRTSTGEAFLAINSHQPLDGPVAWYEAHVMSDEGMNILGGLFPGGLCILHGVNENLGWAHTVNNMDKIDVYQLQMKEKSLQYLFDGQWIALEKRKVKLQVKGIPINIIKNVYWSRYGATVQTPKGFFAIRLTANQSITAMEQWWRMGKASNFSEFYKALSMQGLPMFNVVYADRWDTIFYISGGKMPLRDKDSTYDWKGILPGNTSRTLWTDFHPITDLPQYINPASGYLYNTNHSPFLATAPTQNINGKEYDWTSGYETFHNNRSARFAELMAETEKLDYARFKKIKYDGHLPSKLWYPINIDAFLQVSGGQDTVLKSVIDDYRTWDRSSDQESRGAAVFRLLLAYITDVLHMHSGTLTGEQALSAFRYAKEHELRYFGKTGIKLGELQQLSRGEKSLPIWGIPDVITAMYTETGLNGMLKVMAGESYIELVRFPKNELPIMETVNCYGSSHDPKSLHFTDQMDLFMQQQTKPMTLDKKRVMSDAVSIYHPGDKIVISKN